MTETESLILKPCPFCGNHKLGYYTLDYMGNRWVIRCDDTKCLVKPFATFTTDFHQSVLLWNIRHV